MKYQCHSSGKVLSRAPHFLLQVTANLADISPMGIGTQAGIAKFVAPLAITLTLQTASALAAGESLLPVIGRLNDSPTGSALLNKAREHWRLKSEDELAGHAHIRFGAASRTDAVLLRKLDPATGQESRDRTVTIFIKRDQSESDQVLDLAHELVHATSQAPWDPYDPDLTAAKYLWNTLEGEGGEVDALEGECKVALELSKRDSRDMYGGSRCAEYAARDSSAIRREKIRADFYRSGRWHAEVIRALGANASLFPALSTASPRFYSSTGHAPYPAALLAEFRELTDIACENSLRRIGLLSSSIVQRAIAAAERALGSSEAPQKSRTKLFLERRCQGRT